MTSASVLSPLIGTRKPASIAKLDLHSRDLTTLPDLAALKKLRQLNLYGNPLVELPASLWSLPSLEQLDLGMLQLKSLPEAVGKLRKLKHLRLDGCPITTLPAAMWKLDLTELRLSYLPITELSSDIGKLTRLSLLWIDGTEIKALPAELAGLRKLSRLRVSAGIAGLDAFQQARPNCIVQVK